MKNFWSVAFVVGMVAKSYAGGDDDKPPKDTTTDRIERLEKELEALKRDAGLPPRMSLAAQEKKEADFKVTFTDGFHLKSTDGDFDLHIGGRWEEEYRHTFNRPTDGALRTSPNTFYVREAFISVDGTIFKNFGFKLNGDFTPPQTQTVAAVPANVSTGAIIEEGWVEWKQLKEFRLQFGSFKQPLSMETTDSPRFAALIQRSPMARFMPNFDLGAKAYGSFADTALTYELALTNGRSHLSNTGRDNPDDNDGKEYAGRLTTAPFVSDKESFLKGLRLGVYGSFAHIGQNAGINPVGWPGNIATNELVVTYMALALPASGRFYGDRYRVGGELTYAMGPFNLRGELMSRHDEYVIPANDKNGLLETIGYYAEASYVITGEERTPNARIVPLHPFNLNDGGWGAVEVAARYGTVNIDRHTVADVFGVNMAANSNRVSDLTLGVNWWMIPNAKICMDYVSEYYSNGVQLSASHHGSHMNGFLMRVQVDF